MLDGLFLESATQEDSQAMIDCSYPSGIMALSNDPVIPRTRCAVHFSVLGASFSKRDSAGLLALLPVERRGNAAHASSRGNSSHVTALLC